MNQGSSSIDNPWPKIGWGVAAGLIVVAVVLGFGVLSRYQQNGPTLDLWNAICRGLGITADIATGDRAAAGVAHADSDRLDQRHARRRLPPAIPSMAPSSP